MLSSNPFQSKSFAYTHAIYFLTTLKSKYKKAKVIDECIENLKIAFENHEQNPQRFCDHLQKLHLLELDKTDRDDLDKLIKKICDSEYKQTIEQKFENPLARRFESELFTSMLLSPTQAMMKPVNHVSTQIIKAIDQMSYYQLFRFLFELRENANAIACGSFKTFPTPEAVKKLLKENDPRKLPEIMHVHYKFARVSMRSMPCTIQPTELIGKYAELVKDYKNYFQLIGENSQSGIKARSFISDETIYKGDLYCVERNRGRSSDTEFRNDRSNQFGLMLASQEKERKGLPTHSSYWCPDCACQDPDFKSPYVRDLIGNDCIYVAGPSGMASILLGLMEMYGNFSSISEKQNYLSAIVAYICGGGFHSGHEVFGPAQRFLELIPGYKVTVPDITKKAPSPNYNTVFRQQAKIDPDFAKKRDLVWENYLKFYQDCYLDKLENKEIQKEKIAIEQKEESIKLTSNISDIIIEATKPYLIQKNKYTAALFALPFISDKNIKKLDVMQKCLLALFNKYENEDNGYHLLVNQIKMYQDRYKDELTQTYLKSILGKMPETRSYVITNKI